MDLRVGLQTKILVHGELVKDEVASEFRKHFTEEERRLVRGELEGSSSRQGGGLLDLKALASGASY